MARAPTATGGRSGISGETLAKLFMRTPEWVRLLGKDGYFSKIGTNLYAWPESLQGYVRYRDDEAKRISLKAGNARIQEARALALELKNARDCGQVVDVDEAIASMDEILADVRSAIVGVSAEFTRDLGQRAALDAILNARLETLSASLARQAAVLRKGGESPEAAGEDDA